MIHTDNISFNIGAKQLLQHVDVQIEQGSFTVIMGPNGAGKSTLLKILAGSLVATEGTVTLNDKSIAAFSSSELAKKRAVLSQHYHLNFPLEVKEIVMMGRYPYFDLQPSKNDERIVAESMQRMNITEMRERDYSTLSGGEAQKAQMSRVLSQIGELSEENKVLFLDEPVSHLDVKYQHELLNAAKNLCAKNVTVVAVLHDVNLALRYADTILFMKEGKLIRTLSQSETLSAELIEEVFDVQCNIITDANSGRSIVVF